jgi:hypothetical protein
MPQFDVSSEVTINSSRVMSVNIDLSWPEIGQQAAAAGELSELLADIDDDVLKEWAQEAFPEWFKKEGAE